MPHRNYSAMRIRPRSTQRSVILRPSFLNPFPPDRTMAIYLRTGMRMSSAIIAVGIALAGIVFVGLWFVTNIF